MATRKHLFPVSGPGVDLGYTDFGPALSRTITEASRATGPVTFYVRDARGESLGYSERDEDGVIRTVRR